MNKLLLFFLIFLQTSLFGCAACQLMTPTAEIKINLKLDQKHLKKMHVSWSFSDVYTEETTTQYDKNQDGKLSKNELELIKKAFLDYLVPKELLTDFRYIPNVNEDNNIKLKTDYKNFDVSLVNEHLLFTYETSLDQELENESSLSFSFEDDEGFFAFVVTDVKLDTDALFYKENLYLFTASILFNERTSQLTEQEAIKEKDKEEKSPINKSQQVAPKTAPEPIEKSTQENLLQDSINKIKTLFESVKDEKNPLTYMMLLVFAYIYGVVHALGPGHGKTLVASYFLSNERSYAKALFISLAIGVVHTFSAFLLTVLIYFILNSFLSQILNDTVFYTTKISAIIIIFIAIYLLYKKYKAYKALLQEESRTTYNFTTAPHIETCACSSCKVDKNSTDAALIISAGIIPCPGTITIFIFSLSLGLYYAGFVSALVMSLGMSTIIFFSAILSVTIRKKTFKTNTRLKKYLEYASLTIILFLGLLLLFS